MGSIVAGPFTALVLSVDGDRVRLWVAEKGAGGDELALTWAELRERAPLLARRLDRTLTEHREIRLAMGAE